MRKTLLSMFVLLLAGFLFLQQANAQVTTNGGSGLATSYPSLASAITALNGVTMTSPVIITLNGNEVAPAGGYVITQAGGTSVNTIQIQGSGNTVTASPAQTLGSLTDAIFKLIGADWVTLKGFTMQENPANTDTTLASNKMTEWGVALLYGSLTNGSQHNTIQNNTISLNRVYRNSFGIYSNTRHSASDVLQVAEVTAASGANSFNHVYGNTISNVNFGVVMIGAGTTLAAIDDGNDIGGSSVSTANSILNWGGGAVRAAYVSMTGNNYGIFMNQQINSNVSYNSLNSAAVATNTVSLGGILQNFSVASPTSGTITITINNNSVSLSDVLTTGGMIGINDQGLATLATATININNNSVFDCFITGANAGAASFTGINNTSSPGVLNINGNLVKNINTVATSGSWTGIYQGGAVVTTCNMDNNQLGNASAGAVNFSAIASSQVVGILNSTSGNNCTMSISSNNFQGFNYATPSTGLFRCINQSDTMLACTINNNNFNNLTINTSASLAGFLIYASSMTPTITISGNYVTTQFSNVTTTGGANAFAIYNAGGPASGLSTITNNNLSNITYRTTTSFGSAIYWNVGSATACNHNVTCTGNTIANLGNVGVGLSNQAASNYGILVGYGNQNNIANNVVHDVSAKGGSTIGIFSGSVSSNAAGVVNIYNNTVYNITCDSYIGQTGSTSAGSAQGIQAQGGPAAVNIYKNKIYDISTTHATMAGTSLGILLSQGTATSVNNIYNNYIGRIYSNNSNYYQAIRGIIVNQSVANTTNLYYNTVYLDGACPVMSFCLYKSSATSKINLRNNIFSNMCTDDGYEQLVWMFAGTWASNTATYLTTSNNNLLYCGTPGTYHLLYADNFTTSTSGYTFDDKKQTLADFQTLVGPTRESASQTEVVPFLNTATGSLSNYLHVSTSVPTFAESGAANISTYTDDFDGDIRQGNTGYTGTGTAPDIGADEFGGIKKVPCAGTPASSTITGDNFVCTGNGTTLGLSVNYTDLGITYQWMSSTTSGGPYTNLGTISTQETGDLTVSTYYKCTITCANSGLSFTTPEKMVEVHTYPTVSCTSNSPVCEGNTLALTCNTDFATEFLWAGPNGFTSTLQNPTITGVSAAGYGSYIVTGTGGGCATEAAASVVVHSAPAGLVVTPATATILEGSIQPITATGGLVTENLLYEDFNGNVTGWTTVNNSTGGTPANAAWMLYLSDASFHSNDNSIFILSNSDAQGSGGITNTDLISPAMNTTGYSSLTLTFYQYFRWYSTSDSAKVEVSIDGGTSWIQPPLVYYDTVFGTSTEWALATVDLSAYVNQANFKIRFHFYAEYGYYWGVDNVRITGTAQAPITWSPTGGLYTNAAATIPYTGGNATALWAKPTINTLYTATATAPSNCTSTGTCDITVNALVPAFTTIQGVTVGEEEEACYNASNTLTFAGGGTYFTVLNYGSVTAIAGQKISILPTSHMYAGGYFHGYISTSYCGAVKMTEATTGKDEPVTGIGTAQFNLFPNPTNGNFTLVQKGDQTLGDVTVEIFSARGEKVLFSRMVGEKSHEFGTSSLPTGIYFVKIIGDNYAETIKLIKTR